MSAWRRCQPHYFSINLWFPAIIIKDHFFFLLRHSLFLPELYAWQIKLVLSTDGGS